MRYKEQINLKLYSYINNNFVLQAIIDDYQEISFSHNLYEAGDFTITINYNIPNALKFNRGMWVQFGNDPYMFGEIISITDSIGEDGKGSQLKQIVGKDARYIFKRRIIKNLNNQENWAMTAKGELCLRNLIKDQCGSAAEVKRRLPITNTIPSSSNAIGKQYSVAEAFTNLYDTLVTIATQSEIGWRIKFDDGLTLEVYNGSDISNYVQFSTDFDSLAKGQFSDTAESFSNAVYVGGKGTGNDRDIYEGENAIEGSSPSGLERYEAWDNQSDMNTESEYEAEALSMLNQYGQTINISGQGLAQSPYIFKENYNIGDIITLAFSGKSAKAQILSVTEHWTWNQYGIEFSFGKPVNDFSRQMQLILNQIQKASNKSTTTESVKYYTIPTDTTMDKSEVIYDRIGFQGTCASGGSTFQLYLDNEKTGAKTYHVYIKQLGGGNLTLTTNKSGANNLVLNPGTYVSIIYVDAEGNISSAGTTATDVIEEGNNQPATSNGVSTAISTTVDSLDVPAVGGSGKYLQSISESAGLISAVEKDIKDTRIGTCSTAGGTQAKTVNIEGFSLVKGAKVIVNLKNANTYANAITLNVSSTGAKTIRWNGTVTSTSAYAMTAGYYNCYYDGTNWCMDSSYEARNARNANWADGASQADHSREGAYCNTAAGTKVKEASMRGYVLRAGSTFPIYFQNSNSYNGKIQLRINSSNDSDKKDIWINGSESSSSNKTLNSGCYICMYDGSKYLIETSLGVPKSRGLNSVTANNMQSVSSGAVKTYVDNALQSYKKDLYVQCNFDGATITVTNNLGRSDLTIEGIAIIYDITQNPGSYSYLIKTTLSSSTASQTINSYGGRLLNNYDSVIINIFDGTNCIASGIIGDITGNQMSLKIVC